MTDDIETKLSAARTRLILDKPFIGALVLRMPLTEGDPKWCKTTATDARALYYNADYIQALSLEQTQFMLAHEAMHCALSHFARRQHRSKHRWDVACDFAINPLLIQDGLHAPPDVLLAQKYNGMTAEEIYPLLDENPDQQTSDQHLYDQAPESAQGSAPPQMPPTESHPDDSPGSEETTNGGSGKSDTGTQQSKGTARRPPPLSESERDTLTIQWQQRLAGAAQQAMQAGKLSADMARLVDHLLQPQLPWREILARYMTGLARDDYSYTRPSSRRGGDAILPSLRSSQIDLIVAVDTSGSIADKDLQEFIGEINAIKGQIRARITLLACDAKLAKDSPWLFEPWQNIDLPDTFYGGGGTDFRPVFEWVDKSHRQPDLLVYFTDAEGEFPSVEPYYPVVWLVKGKHPTPWGSRIQLN